MKFYIVTPAFRGMEWLPACVRSVHDQVRQGVEVHHHVQDGGSPDHTADWLRSWAASHAGEVGYHFTWESAPDEGMYDAINRAWDAMPPDADVTAQLNCDEQYLEGALAQVALGMDRNPRAEVLLATYIITDASYVYLCHRRPVIPRRWSSWLNCACITNATFYRASAFRKKSPRFDTQWRSVGDLVFFRDLTEQGWRFATIPATTSCFVCTGANLAWTEQGRNEWRMLYAATPLFWRCLNPLIYRWVNAKRRLADLLISPPRAYAVYAGEASCRVSFRIDRPTVIWPASLRSVSRSADATDV